MKKIIVVNNPKHWKFHIPEAEIVSAKDYLTNPEFTTQKSVRVFNHLPKSTPLPPQSANSKA